MNHIFKNIISCSLLVILAILGFSQTPEQVVIQRDKAFYVTGETLWYKAYLPGKKAESRILHVELMNQAGESLIHQKLLIDENQGFGEIEIPDEWESGLYTLRAYTLWNLNFPEEYIFQSPIHIYSYEEESPQTYTENSHDREKTNSSPVQVDIQVNPENPARREVVNITVRLKDQNGKPIKGNVSLAATDARFVEDLPTNSDLANDYQSLPNPSIKEKIYDHQQKLLVKGNAKSEGTNQPLESNYLIIWSVDDVKPIWTKSTGGNFSVDLDDFTGTKTLQIHDFSPFASRNPKVELWSSNHIDPIKGLPVNRLSSAKTAGQYLNLRQKRDLIKVVFQLEPVIQEEPPRDTLRSPFAPDKFYFLDKYIPFNTLESFITEGMPWVSVRKLNGEKNILIENYDTKEEFELPPLILMDHYISFNTQEILRLPWKSLSYIEQFMRTETLDQQFGLLGRFGALSMYTRSGKPNPKFYEVDNSFIFNGFHESKKFPAPDFMESLYSKDKVPDFNPTVYWNPDIDIDPNGEAKVRFIQLDGRGEFEIRVEGMTNKGEMFSEKVKYRVN